MIIIAVRIALLFWTAAVLADVTQSPATQPGAFYFATCGLEVVPPPQWVRERVENPATVGEWFDPNNPEGNRFTVMMSPLGDRTIDGVVKQRAETLEATVEKTTLDGRPAFRLDNARLGFMALVSERDGFFYYALLHRSPANGVARDFEAVQASWRWRKIEHPSDCLQLDPTPIRVLDALIVYLPEHFRPYAEPEPGYAMFDAFDRSGPRPRQVFQVVISLPAECQNVPLDRLTSTQGEKLRRIFAQKEPVRFKTVGKRGAIIYDPLPMTDEVLLQQSFVPLTDSATARVDFYYSRADESTRKKYMVAAEEILASVCPCKSDVATPR